MVDIGSRARSREGHAAVSFRGSVMEGEWIKIQENTWTRWINEELAAAGRVGIKDPAADFCDGVKLVELVEALQQKKVGRYAQKPFNTHQYLMNISVALKALEEDGVRLVNIGPEDILEGNLKLIMGLIWLLILRYQIIGKSKIPPKKLMLSWLRAVIPENQISNFTNNWNDGRALHALINYCQPGLCPDWKTLNKENKVENCKAAMLTAEKDLDIPLIVTPEDMSNPNLDELSGMTYLSYYMKDDSPGYTATLKHTNSILPANKQIKNFTTDWNDGTVLCALTAALGAPVSGTQNMEKLERLEKGIEAGKTLGIEPVVPAKDLADPEVDHLGPMAYAAYFNMLKKPTATKDKCQLIANTDPVKVGDMKTLNLQLLEQEVDNNKLKVEIRGPSKTYNPNITRNGDQVDIRFNAVEPGLHRVSVYYDGVEVVGSPVTVKILADSSKIILPTINPCKVGTVSEFKIDARTAGVGEVRVEAVAPSGRRIDLPIRDERGVFVAKFTPTETGNWKLLVSYDGQDIPGSPLTVPVYDPFQVRVVGLEMRSAISGKPFEFSADVGAAGHGDLKVEITRNGSPVPASVTRDTNGVYKVSFTPNGPGQYLIRVFFNDTEVKGSPFYLNVADATAVTVQGQGLQTASRSGVASFVIQAPGINKDDIKVLIKAPNGQQLAARVISIGNGDHRIEYSPIGVGCYIMEIYVAGTAVPGSPYAVDVYDSNAARLVNKNKKEGMVGEMASFEIDCTDAGRAVLEVTVQSPSGRDVPCNVSQNGDRYNLTYVPQESGDYKIYAKYGGEEIGGFPITQHFIIAAPIPVPVPVQTVQRIETVQVPVQRIETVQVPTQRVERIETVQVPTQRVERIETVQVPTQRVERIETVQVPTQRVERIETVQVPSQRLETVQTVVRNVEESALRQGYSQAYDQGYDRGYDQVDFEVLVRQATTKVIETETIEAVVEEEKGSPITQRIDDGVDYITVTGDGLIRAEEDKPAFFRVDTNGRKGELFVQVDGPNSIAKCNIEPEGEGVYGVTYIPVEVGMYDITIRWNGKDIPGTPFHPAVVDVRKVQAVGGWNHIIDANDQIHLRVNDEKIIPLDTSNAGPGRLRAEVAGPTGTLPVTIDDKYNGMHHIRFVPVAEGKHIIKIYWSDIPLPRTPLTGIAVRQELPVDHTKVVLIGRGLKEARVKEEAEFMIDGSEAGPGQPEVKMSGVKADIDVKTVPIGDDKYRCTYIPVLPGAYLLNIHWSDRQVRGSPFKVNVSPMSDASKVLCAGEGLKTGVLGKDIKSLIDTRRAGPGELTAHCMGPHDVAYCELYDHRDGTFTLNVKPQEPGRHVLTVKYSGEHVPGSPFVLRVSGAPDASKVRVTGPGVEAGILPKFQSRFICETRGAGAGQLTVRIRGPKGAFRVEMQRESQKDRTILCRYDPSEVGEYVIHVKWSGDHVPGSPFHVHIFDTEDELSRFIDNNPLQNNHHRSWNAEI
ncbi:filamin-B-like isoform X2 [Tubulanus polymorphus]|uniref:filamin-B-like isoform X2 n=1 Tax=Tubulanus polymorphus TaxID=672921 RepID=UPI003DA2A9EB